MGRPKVSSTDKYKVLAERYQSIISERNETVENLERTIASRKNAAIEKAELKIAIAVVDALEAGLSRYAVGLITKITRGDLKNAFVEECYRKVNELNRRREIEREFGEKDA